MNAHPGRMADDERERIARARRIWDAVASARGTLAERYLRARGVRAALPPSLRFAERTWHGPAQRRLPALVAAVARGRGFVGIHGTFLAEPGRKAEVEPAKMMLGPVAGGAVRLSRGGPVLVVAEGIETGLSVLDALDGLPVAVWAALSTGGLSGLRLDGPFDAVVVAADGDEPARSAAE